MIKEFGGHYTANIADEPLNPSGFWSRMATSGSESSIIFPTCQNFVLSYEISMTAHMVYVIVLCNPNVTIWHVTEFKWSLPSQCGKKASLVPQGPQHIAHLPQWGHFTFEKLMLFTHAEIEGSSVPNSQRKSLVVETSSWRYSQLRFQGIANAHHTLETHGVPQLMGVISSRETHEQAHMDFLNRTNAFTGTHNRGSQAPGSSQWLKRDSTQHWNWLRSLLWTTRPLLFP
jgi:hypothetical protein